MNVEEILLEITRSCKANKVKELYLFGSYATDSATDTSDIDIIVKGVQDMGKNILRDIIVFANH